jgi:hypothetical protein
VNPRTPCAHHQSVLHPQTRTHASTNGRDAGISCAVHRRPPWPAPVHPEAFYGSCLPANQQISIKLSWHYHVGRNGLRAGGLHGRRTARRGDDATDTDGFALVTVTGVADTTTALSANGSRTVAGRLSGDFVVCSSAAAYTSEFMTASKTHRAIRSQRHSLR